MVLLEHWRARCSERALMVGPFNLLPQRTGATRRTALGLILAAPAAGCAGVQSTISNFTTYLPGQDPPPGPAGPPQEPTAVGTGAIRVGLILPLSGAGNAGVAAQSMRNAAELALVEFQNPNIQLLIKDDGSSPQGAQAAAQQAIDEGAEIVLGPLFGLAVPGAAQVARGRNISVIAFSTDSSVASRGVYLLSFLPESDVERIVGYAAGTGKRSYAAMLPDNAYGNVVEGSFRQAAARRNARVIALERYGADRSQMQTAARNIAQALPQADALLLADDGEALAGLTESLAAAGANLRNVQLLGTGLWDNPRVFGNPALQGGLFAAPDPAGYRSFAGRYRAKYNQEPVRTATLAYDSVALVAALAKTQGPQRFSPEVLQNPSGFAGIDGLFRFKADGTNDRGLAVMRVSSSGAQVAAAAPRSFGV
jgi:ABC-type branched-subunit amino acid transport system substrate-binding protein